MGKKNVPLHASPGEFVKEAYPILNKKFGRVQCALKYQKPHELAVAVILSAQCTDEQVNRISPELFRRFRTPEDFATASPSELEKYIYSTGFYRNKAKNIIGFNSDLVNLHGGSIPEDLKTLVKMPGVGRKTANVILQELFNIPSGIVIDTHASRLSRILGLTAETDPVKIERGLMQIIPQKWWINWSLYMIRLGRTVCTARKRTCNECVLRNICISSSVRF